MRVAQTEIGNKRCISASLLMPSRYGIVTIEFCESFVRVSAGNMPIPLHPAGKFYFPNIVLRLVRSNLPPHQAVFHCPQQLNKIDIKSYLSSLYGIEAIDVRTMNYTGHSVRYARKAHTMPRFAHPKSMQSSYKKVIVTMEEDFVFPDPPSVEAHGAIRLPPRLAPGRNSANRHRAVINKQATERGVDLSTKQEL